MTTDESIKDISADAEEDTDGYDAADAAEPDFCLLWVDPHDLIIGVNARKEVHLDRHFVADIRRRGVQEPITARRGADGELVVRKGQRRALGAIEAQRAVVPVLLTGAQDPDEDDQATIDRIVDQLGENEHRDSLSERDELGATQELLDLGLSARQIATKRSISRKRSENTATIARSSVASEAVSQSGLDLMQAGVLAEFDGDDEAQAELRDTATLRPPQLPHVAQRWRDQRAEEAAVAAEANALASQGVRVVDLPYFGQGDMRRLTNLRPSPDDEPGTELTDGAHAECPGHAVSLSYDRNSGHVNASGVCTAYLDHGHAERWAGTGQTTGSLTSERSPGGPMSEADKAYRRSVIARGKEWDSATTVRRDWLRKFAARKSAPKDTPVWTAQIWSSGDHCLRKALESGHALAAEMLGFSGEHGSIAEAASQSTPSRANVITAVLAMAAIEASTDRRHTWEDPTDLQRKYFAQIQKWGYEAAPVETLVTTEDKPTEHSDGQSGIENEALESHADSWLDDDLAS
ncbi:hypothetical protein [Saccharopolyspora sp. SCSIO 74807]|uniref:ParB/RepB/Spo0J family partition protein n=1 Tax=Saccharopolyspora sp. SCSIO 74807 TaxID=3118084 RepID=UPI0030D3EC7D